MASIETLVGQIADARPRAEIAREVAELKARVAQAIFASSYPPPVPSVGGLGFRASTVGST